MRVDEIFENNANLQKKLSLNTPKDLELAKLSVLTDISETLAILADLYAKTYNLVIGRKTPREPQKEGTAQ